MALLDPLVDPVDPAAPPAVPVTPPATAPVATPPAATPPVTTGLATPWIGSQPQVNDSMASQVEALTSTDSKLNQMARTEGLKAANRRGLLNSSMAVGASQDAVLKNVLPIAERDAMTAAGKNAAARAFEYSMTGQEAGQKFQSEEAVAQRGWQTAERLSSQQFAGTQADLDRDLQSLLQSNQISSNEAMQFQQIASTEGIEAANRALQTTLLDKDLAFRMSEGKLTREAAAAAQALDIMFQQTEGVLDRAQEEKMLNLDLDFRMKQGGLDRAAAKAAQEADINYRMAAGNLDRASAERMQAAEIKANTQIAALDRGTQEKIASWNLSATMKNNIAQNITDVERTYAANYSTIMSNTSMSAAARTAALKSIATIRSRDMSLVEQAYGTNITW